jgi:hypothetical protein
MTYLKNHQNVDNAIQVILKYIFKTFNACASKSNNKMTADFNYSSVFSGKTTIIILYDKGNTEKQNRKSRLCEF